MASKFNSDWIERNVFYRDKPSVDDPPYYERVERPVIVCLCGSTRFPDSFMEASKNETLAGKIVLSVGTFGHLRKQRMIQDGCMGEQECIVWTLDPAAGMSITPEQKVALDELHKRKIDLADEVLILNVGGYIGESTASELAYAKRKGKRIRFLEPDVGHTDAGR